MKDEDATIVYLGSSTEIYEKFIVPSIGSTHPLYHVDPSVDTSLIELAKSKIGQVNKVLLQRYSNVERVKEATIISILVGTVVVPEYLTLISKLKEVITKSGKKCYEVLVGKINEPKLKNLAIVDLYVYVGCRETSLIEFKQFMMTLVTPHELLMALLPETFPWECRVITDFGLLIPKLTTDDFASVDVGAAKTEEEKEDDLALVKAE